jgi:hypothetical protein
MIIALTVLAILSALTSLFFLFYFFISRANKTVETNPLWAKLWAKSAIIFGLCSIFFLLLAILMKITPLW